MDEQKKLSEEYKLTKRIRTHFQKGLVQYSLIDEGDKILIAISGGKDSLALLELLAERSKVLQPRFTVEAAHVVMTNIKYESDHKYLEEFAASHGVKLHIVETSFDPTTDNRKSPCFLCSWNRRKALFMLAKELGCKVGDVITAKFGDKKEDYIVTGINQRLMQAGRTATMVKSGAKRLGTNMSYDNYYVTAEDGVTYEELKKTFEDYAEKKNLDFSYTRMDDMISSVTDTLTVTMSAVCVLLSIITILIVIFVESLVIRAKVTREWRGMGISKALGMSSGELLTQIMLSNIPAIIVGCVIGALLSSQAGKAVVEMAFSYMGVQNVHFNISFIWMVVVFVGIVLVAMMTSGLAGRKVKRINPIEMITEE
jgi:hypothetical protein